MKYFYGNKWLIWTYSFFLFLGLLVGLSHFFPFSPFWALIVLFGLIFIPGFSLARILQIKFSGFVEQIMTWMSLGWLLVLAVSFLAIVIKIDIGLLATAYAVFTGLFFALSLALDLFKTDRPQILCLGKIFRLSNLPLFIVLIVLMAILWLISIKGVLFRGGDTLYHLSLLRKVVEGQSLTIQNLAYVEGSPEIAYTFPLWHIVMGMVSKIAHANMFMVYREMVLPLSCFVFLAWYWLFKLVLPFKSIALIVLVFFVFLLFNQDFGYIFSTLSIPHSLTEFLFLPLLVGLAYNYFFNEKTTKMYSILIPLLAIMTACVHMTVFFYFLFVLVGFTGLYGLLRFKDPDFKPIFKKMLIVLGLNLGLIAVLALVMQLKTHGLTQSLASFQTDNYPTELNHTTFQTMNIYVKYAFLCLPLIFIFCQKNKKLLLIVATFLVFLLAYSQYLHLYLNQMLGFIFMKRLYTNILWYWLPIGFVVGLIGLMLDKIFNYINLKWNRVGNIISGLTIAILFWLQFKHQFATIIFNQISSDRTNNWLNQNINWLITIMCILAILIYLIQVLKPKFAKVFVLRDFQNPFLLGFIVLFCLFVLSSLSYKSYVRVLKSRNLPTLFTPTAVSAEQYSLNYIGGQDTLDFIKANIPAKSIFNTYGGFFYLPTVADVHMTSYNSKADQAYSVIYKSDLEIPIKDKIKLISDIKAQYLLINASPAKSKNIQENLDAFPQYFEKVYNRKVVIYKINQENIQKDLP